MSHSIMKNDLACASLLPVAYCRGAEATAIESQRGGYQALVSELFEGYEVERRGEPLRSHLNVPGGALRSAGFQPEDVRRGLLAWLAFSSVQMGYPMLLEFMCQGNDVSRLLTLTRRMVPPEFVLECAKLTPDLMLAAQGSFRNKVLLSTCSDQLLRARDELNDLFETGGTTVQEILKSGMRTESRSVRIEGPSGCVLITRNPSGRFLTGSMSLTVHHIQEGGFVPSGFQGYATDALDVDCARSHLFLRRLMPRQVNVPFLSEIRRGFSSATKVLAEALTAVFARLVSLAAVLHNPPPLTHMEYIGSTMGVSREKMEAWGRERGLVPRPAGFCSAGASNQAPLTATKFDYFVIREIFGEIQPHLDAPISSRQKEVLEAVRKINIEKGRNRIWEEGAKEHLDRLKTLHTSDSLWADIFEITGELEETGRRMAPNTLRSDLKALVASGFLASRKEDRTGKGNLKSLYGVTDFREDSEIALPHPSEIVDPVYQGRELQVINPISGATETI